MQSLVTRLSAPAGQSCLEATALGASKSALPGTAPAKALHTFTLDSGASLCFFRNSTTVTPLSAPIPVKLADPSGGPSLARSSTVLPCPAVPSGSLSGLHLPSFSTNLVALQDAIITTTTPWGQHVSICTCTQTGPHLATFTRRPGSSLYTLATEPPKVAASAQVSALSPVAPPFSCRLLSHLTLLRHHRLGHPSLPRLRGMHSRLLVSGLPRSQPPLAPSPSPPYLPCVEGRQRTAPHSSFPPTNAPLQTLHMDVWGPARVGGHGCERYFLLVVDDYTRYTTVFPLRSKGELFTLPASPQQNGISKHRIGLVTEVARTSMIHAAAPHFLWPFAVRYAAHQLNLWPCVSLPETSPTLHWTGKVGDALVFRVWGSRALVCDTSADKLSAHAIPRVFLGFPTDSPGWQFYHPTSRRVLSSQTARGAARGAASGGAEPVRAEPGGAEPAGAEPGGAESEGAGSGGAELGGAELGGAEPEGAEPGCAESKGAESGGIEPRGTTSSGGPAGASPQLSPRRESLSPQQMREWFARRTRLRSGAAGARGSAVGGTGAGGARGASLGYARVPVGAGGLESAGAAGPGGATTRGTGAAGAGGAGGARAGDHCASGAGAGGTRAVDPGAWGTGAAKAGAFAGAGARGVGAGDPGAGGTVQRLPFFVPPLLSSLPPTNSVLRQVLKRHEPESRPASLVRAVRTGRRVPCPRPPPVLGTHVMELRPYSVPLRVPLPPPPKSSIPTVPDLESDLACATSPTLVELPAACRLDYATSLVTKSESNCPPSVEGECALGTDVLEDKQEDFECLAAAVPHLVSMLLALEGDPDAPDIPTPRSYVEAIKVPYSSRWLSAMDAEMASWNSTGTYVDAVPSPGANIVDGMWIFRVKWLPGSPPDFKARYVARGFSQRQGVDFFQTFSPTLKMTTLQVLLYVAAQIDYKLHSLDFSKAFLQGTLHEEIWLRRPHGFTGSFPAGTQTTLAAPRFAPSIADPSLFLRTDTSLPPFYVLVYVDVLVFATADTEALALVLQCFSFRYSSPQSTPLPTGHSLSAPPSDEFVEPSDPYPELVGCLISNSEAEFYAGAMAAQELRWLTYLLNDLGERPRSSPVFYVHNKAMIALCQEHRTKHIALRYFLARELQQRGQLSLAHVATRANTAEIFTKALQSRDHQRFCTVLGLVPTWPHLLTT
ncbi:unnamed protein product [Closterium sp. NIES-53]